MRDRDWERLAAIGWDGSTRPLPTRYRHKVTPDKMSFQMVSEFDREVPPAPPGPQGAQHWRGYSKRLVHEDFASHLREWTPEQAAVARVLLMPPRPGSPPRCPRSVYHPSLDDDGRIERTPAMRFKRGLEGHVSARTADRIFSATLRSVDASSSPAQSPAAPRKRLSAHTERVARSRAGGWSPLNAPRGARSRFWRPASAPTRVRSSDEVRL